MAAYPLADVEVFAPGVYAEYARGAPAVVGAHRGCHRPRGGAVTLLEGGVREDLRGSKS
jgi:uncharacterized protein (DUF1330 family)